MKNSVSLIALVGCLSWSAMVYAAEPAPGAGSNPDLRLALAKVSLYAETNKTDQAFALIKQLKAQYPNNPQVLEAEADLNLRIGNRGAGFAALNKAMQLDPSNEDILARQRAAILEQGPFAAAGYRFRSTKETTENFERFTAQSTVTSTVSALIDFENDHVHSKGPVVRVDGGSRNVSDNRQRGTFSLGKTFSNGDEAAASLYAANNVIGGGARYSLWDSHGASSVSGNIHQPEWSYVETVIEGGSKDNARLERKQIINDRLQATLGGGVNRYNLHGDSDVADAGAWDLNVAYNYPYALSSKANDVVMLGAYYTVDAEYFTHVDHRTVGGTTFKPLPASSYEIHSLNLSASRNFSSQVYGEAYGGYAIDRLGNNGPLFGAVLEYSPAEHLGVELRGTRTMLGGEHNSEKEDQIGLNVKWRW